MKIRPANNYDARAIGQLIATSAAPRILDGMSRADRRHFLHSNNTRAIRKFLAADFRYYVAEDHTTLVGVVGIKPPAHLYHLFIADGFQGRGLGRQLWGVARKVIAAMGSGTVTVNASHNAIGFYQGIGFVATQPLQEKFGLRYQPMARAI